MQSHAKHYSANKIITNENKIFLEWRASRRISIQNELEKFTIEHLCVLGHDVQSASECVCVWIYGMLISIWKVNIDSTSLFKFNQHYRSAIVIVCARVVDVILRVSVCAPFDAVKIENDKNNKL